MTATSKTVSGAAGNYSGPTESAFARRIRHRRLLSYLSLQGLDPTFESMVRQTDAYLCVDHLQELVAGGLRGEALDYLRRFLPPGAGDDIEARPILLFLHTLRTFANIASASARQATVTPGTHIQDLTVCLSVSRSSKLRNILNLILHSPQFRANLNWGVIMNEASWTAFDLAHDSPELSRRLRLLPSYLATPHDVVPICPRRVCYVKQPPRRLPAHAITKLYLKKRRSLPSSSPRPGVGGRSLNQVANLIKECFEASVSLNLFLSNKEQDAPAAPFFNTKISTLTDPAKNIGASLVPNAGAPVSCPAKTSVSATDADAPGATFFNTKISTLTDPAKNIGASLVPNAVNTFKGIFMRKHPRTEVSAVQEEPDLKRQPTCIKLATDLLLTNED